MIYIFLPLDWLVLLLQHCKQRVIQTTWLWVCINLCRLLSATHLASYIAGKSLCFKSEKWRNLEIWYDIINCSSSIITSSTFTFSIISIHTFFQSMITYTPKCYRFLVHLLHNLPNESPLDKRWPRCSFLFEKASDKLRILHHCRRVRQPDYKYA